MLQTVQCYANLERVAGRSGAELRGIEGTRQYGVKLGPNQLSLEQFLLPPKVSALFRL